MGMFKSRPLTFNTYYSSTVQADDLEPQVVDQICQERPPSVSCVHAGIVS